MTGGFSCKLPGGQVGKLTIYLKPTIPSGNQTVCYESYGPSSFMILPLKMGWIVRSFIFITLQAGTKMCTQTNLCNTMI